MACLHGSYSPGPVAPSLNPGRAHCSYSSLINMSHDQLSGGLDFRRNSESW